MRGGRVFLGKIGVDPVTLAGALDGIAALVGTGRGGTVFTPNVDHVVRAEEDDAFREAYSRVDLSLVDGVPVLWALRAFGAAVPEKVSGSDLVLPLMERAAERGWRVYLLGGAEGVPAGAAQRLVERYPSLRVVGTESPWIDPTEPPSARAELVARIRAATPDVVLVALGSPKQELFCDETRDALRPAVLVGVGASLDFIAGTAQRAPAWVSCIGLEWFYRLAHEPRRLWRRYLLRDPKFIAVLAREARARRAAS